MRKIHSSTALTLLLGAALGLSTLGCACGNLANREEYSIAMRTPAHRYRPYSGADTKSLALLNEAFEVGAAGQPGEGAELAGGEGEESRWASRNPSADSESSPGLTEDARRLSGPFERFRPFSYCYLHQSSHAVESAVALPAAPVEYALGMATTLTVNFANATVSFLNTLWSSIFPQEDRSLPGKPPEPPLKEPVP